VSAATEKEKLTQTKEEAKEYISANATKEKGS
jgi:hypothetical protein